MTDSKTQTKPTAPQQTDNAAPAELSEQDLQAVTGGQRAVSSGNKLKSSTKHQEAVTDFIKG